MADTRTTDIEDVTDYVEKTNTSKYTTLENGFEVGYEKYIMNVNSQEASNDNEIREVIESVPEAIYKEKKNTNRKSKIVKECRTDKEDIHNKTLISYEETLHQIDEEAQMRAQCDESIVGHNTDYLTENTIDYADGEHDIATYENFKPATNQGLTNTLKTLFTTDQNDEKKLKLDATTPVNERIYETSSELMKYTNQVSKGVIALASALKETVGVDLETQMAETSFKSVENTLTGEYISKFENNTNLERDIYDLENNKKAHVKEQTIVDYINAITNALLDYVSNHENTKLSREVYDLEGGRTSIEKIKVKDYIDECINQVLDYVNNHENTVLSREVYNTSDTKKTQVSKIKVKEYIDECINQMLDYVSDHGNTILEKDFYDGKNTKSTVKVINVKDYVDSCINKILEYVSGNDVVLSRDIVDGTTTVAKVSETNVKDYIDACINNVLKYISVSNQKLVGAINALALDTAGVSDFISFERVDNDKAVITNTKTLNQNIDSNFKAVTDAVNELKNITTGVSTSSFTITENTGLDKIEHNKNTVGQFTSDNDYTGDDMPITADNLYSYVRKADKALFARSSNDSEGKSVGDIMFVSEN